jgi:hypothetical protein
VATYEWAQMWPRWEKRFPGPGLGRGLVREDALYASRSWAAILSVLGFQTKFFFLWECFPGPSLGGLVRGTGFCARRGRGPILFF